VTGSLLLMLATVSCIAERAEHAATEERDGVRYPVGGVQPFSGIVFTLHDGSEQLATEKAFERGLGHGRWVEYYPNGQRKREAEYRDGHREGSLHEWNEAGRLVLERQVSGGKPHGPSTTWHPNGQIESESTYQNGSLDGLQTLWYEDGARRSERTFRDGKQHGPATDWHPNGERWREVNWKDGTPDGAFTEWYDDGQKRAEGLYRDGNMVELTRWDEEGNEQPSVPLPAVRETPTGPPR
jgi:antitoxin component YwqK of YwqJK toxin-antitoxin module